MKTLKHVRISWGWFLALVRYGDPVWPSLKLAVGQAVSSIQHDRWKKSHSVS